ncbi:MAG: DNA pilot protein [Chaetfec virus UA24_2735]|nr:MAG: DNA pilot protein [Chaetfec virus UA24_2735]
MIGTGINSRRQYKQNKRLMNLQYDLNEKAAQSSFDRSIQAWNLENQYNTPSAQMERYKSAGLNPQLIYGNSNTSGGLSAPAQSGTGLSSTSLGSNSFSNAFSAAEGITRLGLAKADIDLRNSNTALNNQRINESNARVVESLTRSAKSSFDLSLARELRDTTVRSAMLRTKLLDQQVPLAQFNKLLRGKEWEDYSRHGIRPQDPFYLRLGSRGLSYLNDSFNRGELRTGNAVMDNALQLLHIFLNSKK